MTEPKDVPAVEVDSSTGVSQTISKQRAYSKASQHFIDAMNTVVDIMNKSRNDNARLGAARTIIDKVLPDLKAAELTGEGGGAIEIIFHSSLEQKKR